MVFPPVTGTLHRYTPKLVAFEHSPPPTSAGNEPETPDGLSTILFVGGLCDNLLTVPYTPLLASNLPPSWRFMQVALSSSSLGWGIGSLGKDVEEIAKCVGYVRSQRPNGRIILMGHSTGCQDAVHYLVSPLKEDETERAKVDGVVLQAPASDREALEMNIKSDKLESSIKLAQEYVDRGDADEVMPKKSTGGMPNVSARRWLSLVSPAPEHAGEDDMFSSDFTDERLQSTFGRIGQLGVPILLLYSGQDECVPKQVDKEAMVARWLDLIKKNGGKVSDKSGVVPGLDHNGQNSDSSARLDLVERVVAFAKTI